MTNRALRWTVAFGLFALLGCHRPADQEESSPHEEKSAAAPRTVTLSPEAFTAAGIQVLPVEARTVAPEIHVTGTLAYDERKMARCTARVGGRVTRIVADYGARVSPGDALAWVDSPELGKAESALVRAVGVARVAKKEVERAKLLVQGMAISQAELLRREADAEAAETEALAAANTLRLFGLRDQEIEALTTGEAGPTSIYPVRSPIAGKVTERKVSTGKVVTPEEDLFVVADLSTVWLLLQIFEKDLPSVRPGAEVSIVGEIQTRERCTGTIDYVGDVLDPHSRTAAARALVDNRHGLLRPGQFLQARVSPKADGDGGRAVPAVPASSLTELDGRTVTFVESGERSFEVRPVRTGRGAEEWVEVVEGLRPGERVAVEGVFTLKSEFLKAGFEEE